MRRMIGNPNLKDQAKWFCAMALLISVQVLAQDKKLAADEKAVTSKENKRMLLVSIPDCKLALIENGEVKKVYSVAVGKKSTPSPAGTFHVVNRLTNPGYYHKGKVVAPGPQNPLGVRWIGLDQKGYGIHGTNEPKSIGKAASHGCIRMAKADVIELFTLVQPGDEVQIRAERDAQIAQIFSPAPVVMAQAQPAPVVAGE